MSTPSDLTCETLRKIEAVGASLEIRTRWLCEDVGRLVHLPDWETKAEDQLVRAEQQAAREKPKPKKEARAKK